MVCFLACLIGYEMAVVISSFLPLRSKLPGIYNVVNLFINLTDL